MIASPRQYQAAREVLEVRLLHELVDPDSALRAVAADVHAWEHDRFHQRFPEREAWWIDTAAPVAGGAEPTKAWHPTYARWRRALSHRRLVPRRLPAPPLSCDADYRAARRRVHELWAAFARPAVDETATLLHQISHFEAHHRPRAPLHVIKHPATGGLWRPERFIAP